MTVINLLQEAVVSISSHFLNMALQQQVALCMWSCSMMSSVPLDRPSSVPITIQSAAYCGVTC